MCVCLVLERSTMKPLTTTGLLSRECVCVCVCLFVLKEEGEGRFDSSSVCWTLCFRATTVRVCVL